MKEKKSEASGVRGLDDLQFAIEDVSSGSSPGSEDHLSQAIAKMSLPSSVAAAGAGHEDPKLSPHLEAELEDLKEAFDVERLPSTGDSSLSVMCALPVFRPTFRLYMPVRIEYSAGGRRFSVEEVPSELHVQKSQLELILNGRPLSEPATKTIESLYVWLEREVFRTFSDANGLSHRDFYYAAHDPRHWGRSITSTASSHNSSSRRGTPNRGFYYSRQQQRIDFALFEGHPHSNEGPAQCAEETSCEEEDWIRVRSGSLSGSGQRLFPPHRYSQ